MFTGEIGGEFPEDMLPTKKELRLKKGAQVMFVSNHPSKLWVNGTLGRVEGFDEDEDGKFVEVEIAPGVSVEVRPYKWDVYRYEYDPDEKRIYSEPACYFIQIPLTLAWAITIHKSQGKTFDRVIIDIGGGVFAPGQIYVALSRCTSLEGIVLKKPLKKEHIFTDKRVRKFLVEFQCKAAEKELSAEEKIRIIENAIEKRSTLLITYLKPYDTKTRRVVEPEFIGDFIYKGRRFKGM